MSDEQNGGGAAKPQRGFVLPDAKYQEIQTQISIFAGLVRPMMLREFIDRISKCETAGPILDPTLYIKGADKMLAVKSMAEALLQFQAAAEEAEKVLRQQLR